MKSWLVLLALGSLFEQALRPLQQVTPPPPIASLSAQACAPCHPREYAQWRGSRHAQAYRNRLFQSSYRREPEAWCIYCHAPLPAQSRAALGSQNERLAEPLLDEGINCAVCHVREGAILTSRAATAPASAAHAMRREPLLSTSAFCAGCHEFNFPRHAPPLSYSAAPMQSTFAEWQRTERTRDCQDCHMPRGEHRFPGGHDVEYLRQHVSIALQRSADQLQIRVRATGIGHSFPTGDPFRRLRLSLCSEESCSDPELILLFRRGYRRTATSYVLERDTTLPPPGPSGVSIRDLTMPLPDELKSLAVLHYRLSYAYAAPSTEPDLRPEERAAELARGTVP